MEYLKRFVLWLLAGAGATLGAVAVLHANDAVRKASAARPKWIHEHAADYSVTGVKGVPFAKVLTVRGELTNNSSQQSDVFLELKIVKGNDTLYECEMRSGPRPFPGKSMPFQLECPRVDTDKVPVESQFVVTALKLVEQ